ncbi:MAG: alpha/beta fold hydrolase [Pseudomonadota bacterium]
MRSLAVVSLFLTVLAGCGERPAAQYGTTVPEATIEPVYVATQRALDNTGGVFGEKRTGEIRYFRADVSVPPTHSPGKIEWPKGPPDAATDFVLANTEIYKSGDEFVRVVKARRPARETQIFVHGYNVNLSDGMYRVAQMKTDFGGAEPMVLFSWASAGDPRGYVYDRDSVLYARDDLEQLINRFTRSSNDRVVLVAHSMGAQLVMEVMRQAALRGNRAMINRINAVVLMSPDIDPDVFRRQARTIGKLPDPFLIFVSQEDRALGVSGLLSGLKPRLGVISSPEEVSDLNVSVIDFTALADGENLGHSVATTSPAAISVLRGLIDQAESGERAFERYLVLGTNSGALLGRGSLP